ncbi:Cytidylate kinase [Desulfocicer vacuolatum DSM 3385]|uniref:Cytidylate kinase n=1 Tax=Desulfocicer vacuolatum DSM 3385 TaxID=1121400 RepID=A0A1W2A0M4_9BACT|nr:cytidylate kinase-like family protein [Desulfocicer vacuolatum]SMC54237.1 Cytidylate kinase [Desulfocicer vacuolatum DSM 3385]
MPIITISRGSYYHGKSVAEKLASKLGFICISRDQVLDNLEEFHLPEIKLKRGLNDAFSILDRFPNGKKRYLTAVRWALLQRFMKGNTVYHGLAGHHLLRDISHVLKVRIIADTQGRVEGEMAREGISMEKAQYVLKKDDEERRRWCMFLYGIDIFDPANYNLVIRIGHLSEDDAVDIIANAATLPLFQETPRSEKILADEALSAAVSYALFDFPSAVVSVSDGNVNVILKVPESQCDTIKKRVEEQLSEIEGISKFAVQIDPYY